MEDNAYAGSYGGKNKGKCSHTLMVGVRSLLWGRVYLSALRPDRCMTKQALPGAARGRDFMLPRRAPTTIGRVCPFAGYPLSETSRNQRQRPT